MSWYNGIYSVLPFYINEIPSKFIVWSSLTNKRTADVKSRIEDQITAAQTQWNNSGESTTIMLLNFTITISNQIHNAGFTTAAGMYSRDAVHCVEGNQLGYCSWYQSETQMLKGKQESPWLPHSVSECVQDSASHRRWWAWGGCSNRTRGRGGTGGPITFRGI